MNTTETKSCIQALRAGAELYREMVSDSIWNKKDPLERIWWSKWTHLKEASDWLAIQKLNNQVNLFGHGNDGGE